MMSRALAFALVAGGCVIAAGTGAYVAIRQNAPEPVPLSAPVAQTAPATSPVSETEAVVQPPQPPPPSVPQPQEAAEPVEEASAPAMSRAARPQPARSRPAAVRSAPSRQATEVDQTPSTAAPQVPDRSAPAEPAPAAQPVVAEPIPEPARTSEPAPAAREPQYDEVVIPASSVIGLQVTTPLSSERTQIEDRVEARVTRDVLAAGRLAIPAGSRVLGSVTAVDRGGKVRERARLGVRFHTLVLADGVQVPLRTDAIYREGDSPGSESARKIGGAAIGGAILGAIIGGGKGAAIGGATGAAGGTAAVMSGDRNAATLPAGTVVTVRLSAPATIEVRSDK